MGNLMVLIPLHRHKGLVSEEHLCHFSASTPMKVLPPWMIKQGMNITEEQRGEVKPETKMIEGDYSNSKIVDSFDEDKKSVAGNDNEKSLQYFKAYYAALLQRQQEQEEAAKSEPDNLDPKSKGISTSDIRFFKSGHLMKL